MQLLGHCAVIRETCHLQRFFLLFPCPVTRQVTHTFLLVVVMKTKQAASTATVSLTHQRARSCDLCDFWQPSPCVQVRPEPFGGVHLLGT